AITQVRLKGATTLTAELRSSDVEKGDLALRFDPEAYSPSFREIESADYLLIGVRHRASGGTWLATVIAEQADLGFDGLGLFAQTGSRRGTALDIQHVADLGTFSLTSGARYLDQQQRDELSGQPPPIFESAEPVAVPPPSLAAGNVIQSRHDVTHSSVYAYGNIELSDSLRATLGASLEEVESFRASRRSFGPKLGVMWDIDSRTTLRAAVIRALQPPFVSKHNIQPTLEPTHIVGFNQQYFGADGEVARRYGVALDHAFSDTLFGGLEFSKRDVEMHFYTIDRE